MRMIFLKYVQNSRMPMVQLVLDQINLKDNRDDEQIIKDILGAMDASSNRYWTFSKDQSMLFVKDVTETNKYKGVNTATYYISDSAKEFLNNLSVNNVIHSYIEINDNRYIASGVMFEYKGELTDCVCLQKKMYCLIIMRILESGRRCRLL